MAPKAIVYGGSGSIGSATARMLHSRGWQLHIVGRNQEKTAAVAAELDAGFTVGDIGDASLFSRVLTDAGNRCDSLVYAVGTITLRSLMRFTEEDFLYDFRVNALGAAMAVQKTLPALKESPGTASIVLVSSVASLQGFSFHASMGMAKGAINGLTLSLAAELAPAIRVNAVAPSLTRTPLAAPVLGTEKMAASLAGLHPMRRLGTANDIGSMVAFLASSEADWITGQIISVDGGRSTLRIRS